MNSVEIRDIRVELGDEPEVLGPFPAVTDGTHWNGWECPRFDFEVACDVVAALIAERQVGGYDEESDRFWTVLTEPVDGLEGLNVLTNRETFDWQEWKDPEGNSLPWDADELSPGVFVDWWEAKDWPEGRKTYGIGAWAWTWDESEPEPETPAYQTVLETEPDFVRAVMARLEVPADVAADLIRTDRDLASRLVAPEAGS